MVQRRYTPPTCTLEITATRSLLARWSRENLFKSLQFSLAFDDPRLPEEEYVTIRGNEQQLEALYHVVTNYVEDFLSYSPRDKIATIKEEVEDLSPSEPVLRSPTDIYLKPRGLLTHDLFLGQLADEGSKPVVHLTPTQLFDLISALEEYTSELTTLPNQKKSRRKSPAWLKTAAITVLTLGLTASVAQVIENSANQEKPNSAIATSSPLPIPLAPPMGGKISTLPTPPKPSVSPTPLIPPPPIGAKGVVSPTPLIVNVTPTPFVKPSPIKPPPLLFPPPNQSNQVSGPREQVMTIPVNGEMGNYVPPPQPPVERFENRAPQQVRAPERVTVVPRESFPPPVLPPPPPPLGTPAPLPQINIPNTPLGSNVGTVTELPPLQDDPSPEELKETKDNSETSKDKGAETGDRATGGPELIAAKPSQKPTLFDSIPQVVEARQYFQERWQPPKGLKDTLEYSLQLDSNGSIQQIFPMGMAAGEFVDRTNMPLVGEPFVSTVADGKRPKIRVLLRPNGKVQTFLEALY